MIAARNIRNLVFVYFGIFFVFSLVNIYLGRILDPKVYLIIVSLSSTFVSFMMLWFMFKTTKVRGTDRTYELGPDLGIRKEILAEKREIPNEAPCSQCDRVVYRPFLCPDCKQLYCGQHSLPSDHNCSQIK
jgi:hypothetical protein